MQDVLERDGVGGQASRVLALRGGVPPQLGAVELPGPESPAHGGGRQQDQQESDHARAQRGTQQGRRLGHTPR
ncbi:hypothetical protein [Cellulomonas soli]